MRTHKRLMKLQFVQELLAWAASLYIRLLRVSVRWDVVQDPKSAALMAAGGPVIGCFWHGSMLSMMPLQPHGRGLHVLISGHRDGLFISRCIKHLGIKTVSGSSRRGGSLALRRMTRLLSKGDIVLITPDGPRGPRMRAKAGAIKAAQLSAAPIIPLGAAATRARTLASWDRFCLPLPFTRGVILWGPPINVPRDADPQALESLRLSLENALNALTAKAQERCGQPAIEPEQDGLLGKGDEPDHARS